MTILIFDSFASLLLLGSPPLPFTSSVLTKLCSRLKYEDTDVLRASPAGSS